jgi:hypothetical protein
MIWMFDSWSWSNPKHRDCHSNGGRRRAPGAAPHDIAPPSTAAPNAALSVQASIVRGVSPLSQGSLIAAQTAQVLATLAAQELTAEVVPAASAAQIHVLESETSNSLTCSSSGTCFVHLLRPEKIMLQHGNRKARHFCSDIH